MDFENLTEEQKAKAKARKTPETGSARHGRHGWCKGEIAGVGLGEIA